MKSGKNLKSKKEKMLKAMNNMLKTGYKSIIVDELFFILVK